MKKLRILAINPDVKPFIDISNEKYEKDDVKKMMMASPSITKDVNMDYENLTKKDVLELSKNKNKYLKEKVDLKKYDLKPIEIYNVFKLCLYEVYQ